MSQKGAKEIVHPLARFISKETTIVVLFALYVVVWHTYVPRTMLVIYGTELWENIDHCLKIIANLVSFQERSLARNLIFNTI